VRRPENRGRKAQILLVDDHELVRFGVARLIEAQPDLRVCGEAAGAAAALELVRTTHPDLAIIDLTLKQGSGLDLVREVKQSFPRVLMIVCSMHDETLWAPRILQAGARGYVNKQQAASHLLAAIREVLAGGWFLSPRMTQLLLERAAGLPGPANSTPHQLLTNRELQVYELIGEGLALREIADRLQISPKTVEFHRERIREKLQLASNSELSRHAMIWLLEQARGGGQAGPDEPP
jgi:DNA-binding NarL/FixJ family response regulator